MTGAAVKSCARCGAPRPKGRVRYCSDDCAALATRERTRRKDDQRLAACGRCAGPKEPGSRGRKYCDACRLIIASTHDQMEYERGRRKNLARIAADESAGKPIRRRTADAPDGTKWCARCQAFRPLPSFSGKKKVAAYCIPCQRSYHRERRVLLHYGLTWEEYEQLLAAQDYRCAICSGLPRKNALAVDHDHTTGEVRGLLCSRCNHRLLGSANDDPARLRRAADYLESFDPRDVFGCSKFVPGSQEVLAL